MSLDDHQLARDLAEGAGRLLVEVRARLEDADLGWSHTMDVGDMTAQRYLAGRLAEERPADAVLSEESTDRMNERLAADRVWIVDPLDGTREFAEFEREDWAVHVALWDRAANDLVAGAVALPARGITLATDAPPRLKPPREGRPRIISSRSRTHRVVHAVADSLDCEVTYLGSAGAKAMAVVLGEADMYVHAGGQYEWDSAAPAAVARAAGLHTSRIDGSPLRYNKPDVELPDLVICRVELAPLVLRAIADGRMGR